MRTKKGLAVSAIAKFPILVAFASVLIVWAIFLSSSVSAADLLSDEQARLKAAQILKGDPYGQTTSEVLKRITENSLVVKGSTLCGVVNKPVWNLHVKVPENVVSGNNAIDGYLVLDARTGKMVCAGLPFLD